MDGEMAKKKRNGGRRSRKIPIFAMAGAAITGYNIVKVATTPHTDGRAVDHIVYDLTGWNAWTNKWDNKMNAVRTVLPAALGTAGSMLASKSGLNRYISAVPWFKF